MSALRIDSVSVRFGGLAAVQDVSLQAEAGEVTGLIGPNGAGKTTTFNVITGLQPPSAGRVFLGDTEVTDMKAHKRARLRMARTFQRLEVFGSLTARENIQVAAEIANGWSSDKVDARELTESLIDRIGLREVAHEAVDAMPTGLARLVELGRALATRPKVLLLDEPGSGLDHHESDQLGDLLLELAGEGIGILLVEHDVELVMKVCARIFVLDFGRLIAEGTPAEIQANEAVQAAYLGAEDAA